MSKISNLSKFYVFSFFSFIYFWIAISVPYLIFRGLSPKEALGLIALYNLFSLFLEYPTGVIGDKFGHTKALALSIIINVIATIFLAQNMLYGGYAIALLIYAFGNGLSSGNDMAVLNKISSNVKRDSANYNSLIESTFFVSSIVGGLLVFWFGYQLTLYINGILILIGYIPLLFLQIDKDKDEVSPENIFSIARAGFKNILENPLLRLVMIVVALVGGLGFSVKNITNSFGVLYGVPITIIGTLIGVSALLRAFGAKVYSHNTKITLSNPILLLAGMILLIGIFNNVWVTAGMILISNIMFGMIGSIIDGHIHELSNDKVRASVFSFKRLVIRLIVSGYLMIIGYGIENNTFNVVMIGTALVFFLLWFLTLKNIKELSSNKINLPY
ncbi:MAG: MFS transporter [Patescibacteria group bacterium]